MASLFSAATRPQINIEISAVSDIGDHVLEHQWDKDYALDCESLHG